MPNPPLPRGDRICTSDSLTGKTLDGVYRVEKSGRVGESGVGSLESERRR